MELDPRDHDIVRLLTGLKIAASEYPPDLLAARRQTYIRRVAEIGAWRCDGVKKRGQERTTMTATRTTYPVHAEKRQGL